jgi:hypothetical protein
MVITTPATTTTTTTTIIRTQQENKPSPLRWSALSVWNKTMFQRPKQSTEGWSLILDWWGWSPQKTTMYITADILFPI